MSNYFLKNRIGIVFENYVLLRFTQHLFHLITLTDGGQFLRDKFVFGSHIFQRHLINATKAESFCKSNPIQLEVLK